VQLVYTLGGVNRNLGNNNPLSGQIPYAIIYRDNLKNGLYDNYIISNYKRSSFCVAHLARDIEIQSSQ